jgi:hypothetical protein
MDGLKDDVQALRETVAALTADVAALRLAATPRRRKTLSGIVRGCGPVAAIPVLVIAALAQSGDVPLMVDASNGNVRMANSLNVARGLTVSGITKMNDSLEVAKGLTVSGNAGIGAPPSAAKLDVSGSVARNVQAIFTRGADANFQLTAQNGDGNNSPFSEVSRFGIQYAGQGWNSGFRFLRGGSALDGAIGIDTWGKERVRIDNRGYVGVGKTNPDSVLDVKGEIRGKPWVSQMYQWTQGQARVQMTRVDRTACFLTMITGKFFGAGEAVEIVSDNTYWYLQGVSQQKDIRAQARCIGTPDTSAW